MYLIRPLAPAIAIGLLFGCATPLTDDNAPVDIAEGHGVPVKRVQQILEFAFLSPLMVRQIIEGLGYRVPTRRLPYRPMYAVGYAWEVLHHLHLAPEPQVTRLHCMKAAVSHSGSLDEARRDFGYEPVHAWRDELAACVPYCREVLEQMRAGRWPHP